MYFWNTTKLANEIKSNKLSETQKKSYYLAMSILMTVSMYLAILGGDTYTGTSAIIEIVIQVTIIIIGINLTFTANGGEGGKAYIERMTLLSLPILVKIFVLSFLIGFVLGGAYIATGNESVMQWGMVLVTTSAQIFYFWRLVIHLEKINT